MADDLGDSHAKSLKQGGQLPEKSTAERLVGSIFVDAGKPLTCKLFPEVNGYDHTISIYSGTNVLLTSISGLSSNTSPLVLSFIPSTTGWLSIKVKNSTASNIGQRVWMNVSYTAPMVLNTRTTAAPLARGMQEESIAWQEEVSEITEHIEAFEIFPNPTSGILQLKVPEAKKFSVLNCTLTASDGKYIQRFSAYADRISDRLSESVKMLQSGIYFLTIREKQTLQTLKLVKN
jgi:alpha-amylase